MLRIAEAQGVQPADEDERLADENDTVERIDESIGVQGQAATPPGTGA